MTSFSELKSILQLKGDKLDLNSNDIDLFFKGFYTITSDLKEEAPEARIFPYRFFKSINIFPSIFEDISSETCRDKVIRISNNVIKIPQALTTD